MIYIAITFQIMFTVIVAIGGLSYSAVIISINA